MAAIAIVGRDLSQVMVMAEAQTAEGRRTCELREKPCQKKGCGTVMSLGTERAIQTDLVCTRCTWEGGKALCTEVQLQPHLIKWVLSPESHRYHKSSKYWVYIFKKIFLF